mmetsp:Transcript_6686/g.26820  ORF Transcript_6686/g.26820 Transcript_6686/m.26820 type:complete len:304 (+) Transcript_6686:2590-3501(+)
MILDDAFKRLRKVVECNFLHFDRHPEKTIQKCGDLQTRIFSFVAFECKPPVAIVFVGETDFHELASNDVDDGVKLRLRVLHSRHGIGVALEIRNHALQRFRAVCVIYVKRLQTLAGAERASITLEQGAERKKTFGCTGREASFATARRHENAIERSTRLIRPVRTTELLNRLISAPGKLKRHMASSTLILDTFIRLERNTGARRVGDDRDEFFTLLELSLLGHVHQLGVRGVRIVHTLSSHNLAVLLSDLMQLSASHLGDVLVSTAERDEIVERIWWKLQRVDRSKQKSADVHEMLVFDVIVR